MSAKCFFHFKWIQNAVDQDRSSELKLIEIKKDERSRRDRHTLSGAAKYNRLLVEFMWSISI